MQDAIASRNKGRFPLDGEGRIAQAQERAAEPWLSAPRSIGVSAVFVAAKAQPALGRVLYGWGALCHESVQWPGAGTRVAKRIDVESKCSTDRDIRVRVWSTVTLQPTARAYA